MALIALTKDHLMAARSQCGGYSTAQLNLIGLSYPLAKAWRKNVVGRMFEEEDIAKFIELKDKHLTEAKIKSYFKRKENREERIKRRAFSMRTELAGGNGS